MCESKHEQGFTLIEVLAALLILAVAAAAVFRVLSDNSGELARVRKEQEALMVGKSALAHVGHDVAAQPGHVVGGSADIKWSIDIGDQTPDPPPAMGLAAFPVHVTVTWQDDRGEQTIVLNSVQLGQEHTTP